jgi:hypothetical protein
LAQRPDGLVCEIVVLILVSPLFPSHYAAGHDDIDAELDRGKISRKGSHAVATAPAGGAAVDLKELEERGFTPRGLDERPQPPWTRLNRRDLAQPDRHELAAFDFHEPDSIESLSSKLILYSSSKNFEI